MRQITTEFQPTLRATKKGQRGQIASGPQSLEGLIVANIDVLVVVKLVVKCVMS